MMRLYWYDVRNTDPLADLFVDRYCVIVTPGLRIRAHRKGGEYYASRNKDDRALVQVQEIFAFLFPNPDYDMAADAAELFGYPANVSEALTDLSLYRQNNHYKAPEERRQVVITALDRDLPVWMNRHRPRKPRQWRVQDVTEWTNNLLLTTQGILSRIHSERRPSPSSPIRQFFHRRQSR